MSETSAKVVADTLSPYGSRLTTLECVFPRFILAELNTHRMLSRNTASSRAIPTEKLISMVRSNPFVPASFGANRPGMVAGEPLHKLAADEARATWVKAAREAASAAQALAELGCHKQLANRVLEPFMYVRSLISATEWENFFAQRTHADAQPEFRELALAMQAAMAASVPRAIYERADSWWEGFGSELDHWHLPYGNDAADMMASGLSLDDVILVCVGRCARVSYLNHGKADPEGNLAIAKRLVASGHMSPFEHVARPITKSGTRIGNFVGWEQRRKMIDGEAVFVPQETG